MVAIDGSRFKAVNCRDRSFSRGSIERRIEQVEASIERYLSALETVDRQEGELAEARSARLKDKIASLREQMRKYKALEVAVHAAPDKQISLTDPDARSMATTGKDTGLVGYNVQAVVDAQHHLIVAHEVTNIGNDRSQLGGFKWSSQHLDGSCDEHSKTALGSFWAGALVLTRSTAGGRARGAAAILGSDCGGHGE